MPDHGPFDKRAERRGDQKRQHHGDKERAGEQTGHEILKKLGCQIGGVSPQDHELPVGHVNDPHLAENNRQAHCHENEDGKQR